MLYCTGHVREGSFNNLNRILGVNLMHRVYTYTFLSCRCGLHGYFRSRFRDWQLISSSLGNLPPQIHQGKLWWRKSSKHVLCLNWTLTSPISSEKVNHCKQFMNSTLFPKRTKKISVSCIFWGETFMSGDPMSMTVAQGHILEKSASCLHINEICLINDR